jgi:two-component system sensor histidine kinase DesK
LWGPLAFTIFYFLPLIFNLEYFLNWRLIGIAIIYIAFLVLYKKALFARGEQVLFPVMGIVLLCVAGTYITPGTQALFGYAAYFCGFSFRFNKGIQGLIGILLAIALSAQLFDYKDVFFSCPSDHYIHRFVLFWPR